VPERKPLFFIGGSQRDIRKLPEDVEDEFGQALLDAQFGDSPAGTRSFGEGLPAKILKLTSNYDGDTYRAAYTVAFPKAVYVLHIFKKKSKSGRSTPQPDKDLILQRYADAQADYEVRFP
jgi:phage-related protein